jgi:glutamate--cysteine ligase
MSTLAFGRAVSDEPIVSIDQLVGLFRASAKTPAQHRVGIEIEDLALRADGSMVPYEAAEGPSIRTILERLGATARMIPALEGERLVGLEGAAGTVSLEPGGQIEFSSVPVATLHELAGLVEAHTRRLRRVGAEVGVRWAVQGYHPFATLRRAEWMPKERYRIMREYLPAHGRLAHRMMTQTASIHCSFDFENDDDWRRKFRAAHLLTPIVQAIFCNSPFRDGRPNGYLSYRARVWEQTDPERCGFPPAAFREDVSMEDYVQYALDVPMMFLVRDGRWVAMRGYSFRRFLDHGYEGSFPTTEDWGLHLSGIFTQVRLKSYIEVRAHDRVPAPLAMAVPALWKGILYDRDALEAALALVGRLTHVRAMGLMAQAARRGLRAEHQGRPLLALARELVEISAEGLRRQRRRRRDGRDESVYLLSLQDLLRRGLTPAEDLLSRFRREWKGKLLACLE